MRNYSLGMRQRLGIAHALLGDPSVLILDEPANGLDPAGIRWMRGLLKGYADRGGTVLLSSHLLNEVELIADEMILIGRGKIVAQGTKAELLAGAGGTGTLVVAARQRRSSTAALTAKGLAVTPRRRRASASRPSRSRSAGSPPSNRIVLTDLRPADGGLEDLFLELTADTQRDDLAARAAPTGAPHEHHRRTHDPRRQPDRPGAVQPPGAGRAAQDVRHPRRPLAADLDRGVHRRWCWSSSSAWCSPRTRR